MAPAARMLLAAGLAGLAAAAPLNEMKGSSFSIVQTRNPNYDNSTFVPKGALSMYKTYLKYGKTPPAGITQIVHEYRAEKAARRKAKRAGATSGSVANDPVDGDEEWVTPVAIGTPAQTLYLDFDSGSSDLWVFSSLTTAADVDGQTLYYPGKSSTAKLLSGYTWDISYGDGSSSSGVVYQDLVNLGGVTFATQAVEAAEKVSSEFTSDTSSSGLLGLAFSTINTVSPTAQLTFFDNVRASLALPVWTADLKHNAAGTYTFGAIDSTAYTGSITYTAVSTSEGYWTFDVAGYAIGSAAAVTQTIAGICDTGTTLLYLPLAIVEKYYAQIASAEYLAIEEGYVFLCSATPPTFSFYVGSLKITIPSEYMNYGALTSAGTYCLGALQPNTGIGLNIFGDIAIKSAFVVFDHSTTATTPYLGWALKTLS